jgi:predicted nuclease of predicted toxin-antitoxin system
VKLLFDCHVAKATLGALRKIAPGIHAEHLSHWRGGAFLRAGDEEILRACHKERRVLLTYDQATIADVLRLWAAEERPHSGVVFADENTVKPNVPADVASAVAVLAKKIGNAPVPSRVRDETFFNWSVPPARRAVRRHRQNK